MKFAFFLLMFSASLFAQEYPKDYFRSPLDIPLQLSGNFGELRSNHFHAGFDFRTQQKEGLNVYAAAEGYVSRVKISTYGYGKAVYITHPNGYTTVYGHLRSLSAEIDRYVKANQYKLQAFEVDLFPLANEIPVKRGEVIAWSGNTGGSEGPHLHFEVRDSKTENIINPLHFGFDKLLPDTRRPVITNLVVYPLDDNSVVNRESSPFVIDFKPQADGTYIAQKILGAGKIGFGITAYDMDSNSMNRNGIYSVNAFLNGKPSFGYTFNSFHFDQTRYINALIDYPRFKKTSQRVQQLFMKNRYPLNLIITDENAGVIEMAPNISGTYRIEVADFNGNKAIVTVPLEFSALPANTPPFPVKTPYFIDVTKDYNFEKDNMSVFFPANSFYDDFYLDFDVKDKQMLLNNKEMPVHTPFTISITDTSIAEKDKDKTFVATFNGKRPGFNTTTRKGDVYSAKVKALGTYGLAKDTIAPVITMAKSIQGKWLSNQKSLVVYIRDELSGIKEYNGYLNGKWILFDYDYKTRRLVHNFDDGVFDDGRNDLKVVVSDNVGNSAIFETHFFKSKTK